MKGWEASARWGCSHVGDQSCPWCANPDGEVWRVVPDVVAVPEPTPEFEALFAPYPRELAAEMPERKAS